MNFHFEKYDIFLIENFQNELLTGLNEQIAAVNAQRIPQLHYFRIEGIPSNLLN